MNIDLRKELRPLDTLAAIAIRQHGIATAIAMHNNTSETLKILASSSSDSSSSHLPGLTIPQPSSSTSAFSEFLMFLLTLNLHRDGGHHSSWSTTKGSQKSANNKNSALLTNVKIIYPDTEISKSLEDCKKSDLLETYFTDVW